MLRTRASAIPTHHVLCSLAGFLRMAGRQGLLSLAAELEKLLLLAREQKPSQGTKNMVGMALARVLSIFGELDRPRAT